MVSVRRSRSLWTFANGYKSICIATTLPHKKNGQRIITVRFTDLSYINCLTATNKPNRRLRQ